MRHVLTRSLGAACALLLAATTIAPASAATLRRCLPGHQVRTHAGVSTMVVQHRRVKCALAKPKHKPSATPSPTSTNPPMGVLIRFAGDAMNSLTVHAGLTVTLRNADSTPHTLVIASEGISVLVPGNDISAFLAPSKPGTYAMTTSENAAITGTLVVVP